MRDELLEELSDLLAEARDEYPRHIQDMSSDDLASVIEESDWLRKLLAEAWDLGAQKSWLKPHDRKRLNPYKVASDAE